MDNLARYRCPRCLGRLDALDVGNAQAALGCRECEFVEESVAVPEMVQHPHDGLLSFPGF